MKQKIKEAITQGYKNLGVPESVVDGLTALGVTVIKDESEIDAFVQGEAVKGVMKSWQSEADKVRTKASDSKRAEYEAKIAELEAKLNGNPPDNNLDKDADKGTPDIAAIVAQAVAAAINPLQEKLNAFEAVKTAELAVKQAQDKFGADEWVKGYPELRDAAWQQAMDVYEDTGRKYTAEQLHEKAMKYFKPLAKAKGLDITQPFKSDGGAEAKPDFSADVELLKSEGVDFGVEK